MYSLPIFLLHIKNEEKLKNILLVPELDYTQLEKLHAVKFWIRCVSKPR